MTKKNWERKLFVSSPSSFHSPITTVGVLAIFHILESQSHADGKRMPFWGVLCA